MKAATLPSNRRGGEDPARTFFLVPGVGVLDAPDRPRNEVERAEGELGEKAEGRMEEVEERAEGRGERGEGRACPSRRERS